MPAVAASVRTLVVSWKDAAEIKELVCKLAFVIPLSIEIYLAGALPFSTTTLFAASNSSLSTVSPEINSVSPSN